MNLSKLIKYPLVLITTSVVILNCTETNSIGFTKKDNNNVQNQSLAYLFVNNIPNFGPLSVCGSSVLAPISNPAVTTGSIRTYYNLANCSPNRVPDFTSSSVTSATRGLTGTSTSSRILSNGNQVGSSGVNGKSNVEVTFILNSSTATLDVISYGDGSGSQFSGPTWRITAASNQFKDQNGITSASQVGYKGQDGVFRAPSSGSTPAAPTNNVKTISSGASRTLCFDFHGVLNTLQLAWDGNCASVPASQKNARASYPISMDPADAMSTSVAPLATAGTRIGFILNNATILNFTVSNQLSQE